MKYKEKKIQMSYRAKIQQQAMENQHKRDAAVILLLSILVILLVCFNLFGFPFHPEPTVTIIKISDN